MNYFHARYHRWIPDPQHPDGGVPDKQEYRPSRDAVLMGMPIHYLPL